nr:MAG TPA: minor tail protein [Caudoviricetes sp.]
MGSVVDRFNEIGNSYAISSQGLGEALQRSAAALYAGGNSFDESMALVTAANEVVQDPDTVGEHAPSRTVMCA